MGRIQVGDLQRSKLLMNHARASVRSSKGMMHPWSSPQSSTISAAGSWSRDPSGSCPSSMPSISATCLSSLKLSHGQEISPTHFKAQRLDMLHHAFAAQQQDVSVEVLEAHHPAHAHLERPPWRRRQEDHVAQADVDLVRRQVEERRLKATTLLKTVFTPPGAPRGDCPTTPRPFGPGERSARRSARIPCPP